jgi:hypothetical protein
MALKLKGTDQLLVYADVHVFGENANTMYGKNSVLPVLSVEVGIAVNAEKTKCMFMSCQQIARQNHIIKITSKSSSNVENSKHLGST